MTDFVPTTGTVRYKRKERGSLNATFMETRDEFRPTCYCCGGQCLVGSVRHSNVTKEV